MKKKKNEKIAVANVKATELVNEGAEARKLNGTRKADETHPDLVSVAAQVAGDALFVRNWKFRNADKHFPNEPLMRRVDKHYPNAHGGPLHVDEPVTDQDVADCQRKAAILKKEGIRYCFISKEMDAEEARKQMAA